METRHKFYELLDKYGLNKLAGRLGVDPGTLRRYHIDPDRIRPVTREKIERAINKQ